MKKVFCIAIVLCAIASLKAQPTFPHDGIKSKDAVYTVLKGATVHKQPGVEEIADVVVHKGRIVYCGPSGKFALPENTRSVDYTGFHIYPGFVELISNYGIPIIEKTTRGGRNLVYDRSQNKALYWNEAIHPEENGSDQFKPDEKESEKLLKLGIGAVLTHQQNGIARGTSAMVLTGHDNANNEMIKATTAVHYSFLKGNSPQNYPSSVMGSVALLRQVYYDAAWYATSSQTETNQSLAALNSQRELPAVFHTTDKYDILRAARLANEFGHSYIIADGEGQAYQVLSQITGGVSAVIAPLKTPAPFDVSDPDLSRYISQADMLHWESAAYNAFFIKEKGLTLVLSANGIAESKTLFSNMNSLLKTGLSKSDVLAALTTTPAFLTGVDNDLGKVESGYLASFFVTKDDIFAKPETPVLEHWVRGKAYILKDRNTIELAGKYDLNIDNSYHTLTVEGKYPKYDAKVIKVIGTDTITAKATLNQLGAEITLQFAEPKGIGNYRLSAASLSNNRLWDGKGLDPSGKLVNWSAIQKKENGKKAPESQSAVDSLLRPPAMRYPFTAYYFDSIPHEETLLIENATIWTNEAEGIITKASLLIHGGRIVAIGKNIDPEIYLSKGKKAPVITRIDASGKHITAGIIDEHSHIAISRGVNEGTQASTAEVRIGDALYPDDINIYRQLAGGVTTSQLLHGSANPIGGQSAIIKLRWGAGFDELIFKEAPPFIKFALGENVKQSNWGDGNTTRYPQTRMGVEQFYYDYFLRAKEYGEEKTLANSSAKGKDKKASAIPAFRNDLEMEAILEILEGKRFITCHSYVQSEINMLMHVADSMGFKVNTFTHILEGYKVADKMKKHGVHASSFSDWWAYKYEVKDAIPHNAAILNEMGVITAINSDDAEMGRRLNQEAAKSIKYGNMSEEDALKMVTLNPAIMLHIDEYVGSIKTGKHADFVIWSGHPLSVYSKAEMTFIDGRRFFDRTRSAEFEKRDAAERARIATLMLKAKESGAETRQPERKMERYYHCDSED